MDSIRITGGKRLSGQIPISGAKNSALTLLPCALLTEGKLTLGNLPRLADVDNFSHLLNGLGVSTKVLTKTVEPFLLRHGMIVKSDGGVRLLTEKGREHLASFATEKV